MKTMPATLLTLLLMTPSGHAEPLVSAFEPLPPHIDEQGGGLVRRLFERLEADSGRRVSISMMPYSRAKLELLNGRADLIGFTPFGREVEAFYRDAREIRWPYAVEAGFIALTPQGLNKAGAGRVGIPYGNEAFAALMLDIAPQSFYQAKLEELVLMLFRGRIDRIWFDRLALEQVLESYSDRAPLYFQRAPAQLISIGLAVRRGPEGERIRAWLEPALERMPARSLPALSERLIRVPAVGEAPNGQ